MDSGFSQAADQDLESPAANCVAGPQRYIRWQRPEEIQALPMRAHVPGAAGEIWDGGEGVGEERLPDLGVNAGVLGHQPRTEQSGRIPRIALEVLRTCE